MSTYISYDCWYGASRTPLLAFDNPVILQNDTARAQLGVSWVDYFQWCPAQRYASPDAWYGVLGVDLDTVTFDQPGIYPIELNTTYYLPQVDERRALQDTFHLTVLPAQ